MQKKNFYSLSFEDLKIFLIEKIGVEESKVKMRAQQLYKGIYQKGITSFSDLTTVTFELRKKIDLNLTILDTEDKNELIRKILLSVIDEDWRLHLNAMDHLRQGIGLRGYAAKNPKNEYKRESFEMFEEMLSINNHEIVKTLSKIKVKAQTSTDISNSSNANNVTKISKKSDDPRCLLNVTDTRIPRNKKCPVTNKKFNQCCGKL